VWKAAAVPRLRTSDGVGLHFTVDGGDDAPPVVLLHGLGSDGRADQSIVDAVGDRLRVLRLDMRGHGASEPLCEPDRYGWFDRAAADVVELLDEIGLASSALQGGSLGAAVATATVLSYPDRVHRLGLSSVAIGAGPALGNPVAAGFTEGVAQLGLVGLLDSLVAADLLPVTPEELASARENYARQHDGAMRACVAALSRSQLLASLDELAAINCQTLVIARRGDALHPFELGEEFARRIPFARFVEDDGPVPMYLRPADAADVLVDFHTAAVRALDR
jgi:pimeloyl-ACP methyl ester carboxylesterase